MPEWLTGAAAVAVSAALGFLGWIATRKTDTAQRVTSLEARINDLERKYGRSGDYIEVLREHINTGKPPPSPPYPPNYFD
ncbi:MULTISPECIES: hypothetical protein [unclassified Cryobacterium]|uniref:hypothetical protein n=1 Tax=unclassified Cryobacterium TaxID=2649013 RepID=UPI00106C0342|nr:MULTISPECIES: hypothetical protein [unclassified Cryobacterium]TFC59397.1 hypothetical protein E3O68_00415 [Cryobacterium sp. TMB3-1-2]TFC67193.1 hypothetical protein E3T21_17110 [Cryobacterium sp. TMB3-15]TFC73294.1 hypothetical protein E3T22_16945 [Cryobacterium sp. TMB3-10]TFD46182.1 hypothetical protein E3T58_01580 [Cryobacterium sp. TMB3-12]